MLYKNKNFSFQQPVFKNGDIIEDFNLTQKIIDTEISPGVPNLIFRRGNLQNCKLPDDAIKEDCLVIKKDFCYWLNPEMELPEEVENCRHVIDTDTITINGEIVETIYHREDTIITE